MKKTILSSFYRTISSLKNYDKRRLSVGIIPVLLVISLAVSVFGMSTVSADSVLGSCNYELSGAVAGTDNNVRIVCSNAGIVSIFDYVSGSQYSFNGGLGTVTVSYANPAAGTFDSAGTKSSVSVGNPAAFKMAFPTDTAQAKSSISTVLAVDFGTTNNNLAVTPATINLCDPSVHCNTVNYDPALYDSAEQASPDSDSLTKSTITFNGQPFTVTVGKQYEVCAAADYIVGGSVCKTVTATKAPLTVNLSAKGDASKLQAKSGSGGGGGGVSSGGSHQCGDPNKYPGVKTIIDLGCTGHGNPVLDMVFGIIKFLSYGVGLVIVASMIYAGIMYTSSRGDPNATAQAIGRIRANVVALLLFVFAFAILNYVVPGQLLK